MKKLIVSFLAALICFPALAFWNGGSTTAPSSTGGVAINLGGPAYYAGYNPFLNWWTTAFQTALKISGVDVLGTSNWNNGYFDATTGELIAPVPGTITRISRGFFEPVNYPQYQYEGTSFANFAGEVWDFTWDGCAATPVLNSGQLGTGGTIVSTGTNTATITFGSPGSTISDPGVGLDFVGVSACTSNPPHNIKLYQHRYASSVAAGKIFNPDWEAAVGPFYAHRWMDMLTTIGSGISDISQLADTNFANIARPFTRAQTNSANVTSGVLTVNADLGFGQWAVGTTVVMQGLADGTTITGSALSNPTACTPNCTGSGGNGTYALSGTPSNLSNRGASATPTVGTNQNYGPKGGVHPHIQCVLANETGANIDENIPITMSDAGVTALANAFKSNCNASVKVRFRLSNETWNNGSPEFVYTVAKSANVSTNWQGYQLAHFLTLIYNAYGAANRSRWQGIIETHGADQAFTKATIAAANTCLADHVTCNPSGLTFNQVFDEVDDAPYFGMFFGGGTTGVKGGAMVITAISTGATTTFSACNDFTASEVVRMEVQTAKFSSNSVFDDQYATVASVDGVSCSNGSITLPNSHFTVNTNTTGSTYSGNNQGQAYAMNASIFKLIDYSATLNSSTPATYPTKWSYFTQQFSTMLLNGTVSFTIPADGTYRIDAQSGTSLVASDVPLALQQQALVANANGMVHGEYEGGNTTQLISGSTGGGAGGTIPPSLLEALIQYNYDAGVVGDTGCNSGPCNIGGLYAYVAAQAHVGNSPTLSQYTDATAQTQFGPWGALRFFPGDTSNGNTKWNELVTLNSQGQYSDPIGSPTWSWNLNGGDHNFISPGGTSLTCPYTAPSNGLAVVGVNWADGSSVSITSISIDGGAQLTQDAYSTESGFGWNAGVWSGPVTAGVHTVSITFNTFSHLRSCYAGTLTNLQSNSARSGSGISAGNNISQNVQKGSFIFVIGAMPTTSVPDFCTASTTGSATGTCTQIDNASNSQGSVAAYWSPGPSFSTPIFNIHTTVTANAVAAATYR